ncbi:unnamed protein product [Vicia faba]|uniref:Uncharacterized protein n=1 Tax=Vicia faba TaxID=3906 RepID=A0AAV1AMZ2_VICFA|nr:unnamed protein product [Vicia faba]
MSISQPKHFYFPNKENVPLYFSSHSSWESFPVALVISGRGFNKNIMGSVKRKFEQLIKANSDMDATLDKFLGGSHPLAFYREELLGGTPNSTIPLLVQACMVKFDVWCILVDQGSLVDIMYTQLFATLQLNESHLTPYMGSDL